MRQIKKVSIIGAGSWGTAVAKSIAESKPHLSVVMWAYEKAVAVSINTRHENTEFLPGITLPTAITATNSLEEAVTGSTVVILATPSKAAYEVCRRMSGFVSREMYVGFLTKGFCKIDGRVLTISQAMERAMPQTAGAIVAISGPSHAEEVCRRFHTCLNAGSMSEEARSAIAGLLTSEWIQCRTTEDIRAVEVGGTLKNPAAIAAGMISALPRCGDNLAGALMSEALREMIRLGAVFGISGESMIDISGLGDLVATALSPHSRNRRFGRDIAGQIMKKGDTLNLWDRVVLRIRPYSVIERMSGKLHYLAEGAYAIEPLIELAEKEQISIPVYRALYEVLLHKKDPSLLIETIKDPGRFDDLFFSTKIQIAGRRKGLEMIKGKVFKEHIVDLAMERFVQRKGHSMVPNQPDEVMASLSEFRGYAGTAEDEKRILMSISRESYADSIRALASVYIEEISDSFSNRVKWMMILFLIVSRVAGIFLRREGKLVVSGSIDELRRSCSTATILYAAPFVNRYDSIFAMMAIARARLPFPRFFVDAGVPARDRFLLKRCGGYTVDRGKLANTVYRETLAQYIATMAGYGVPMLYVLSGSDAGSGNYEKDAFLSAITDSMYRHAVELALVPFEVSYLDRPKDGEGAVSFRDIVANVVWVNFSKPIFLSEFTKQPHMLMGIPGVIAGIWEKERKIFPHYLLCRALADNDYAMRQSDAVEFIKKYMRRAGRRFDYNPAKAARKGARYLEKNGIAAVEGDTIRVNDREKVAFYAGLIP